MKVFLFAWLSLAVVTLSSCTDEAAMLVTVKRRPAVVGATSLAIELKNGAGLAGDSLEIQGHDFPLTFSVSSPGRTGDLELVVAAKSAAGLVVGRGTATIPIAATSGEVLLDSVDFVVNTNVVDDQYLTNDYESVGAQLGATSSGEWVATFRERCTPAACNVFARRFNRDGEALISALAAGTNAFTANIGRVGLISSPSAAAGSNKTLLFWETTNLSDSADGIACRPIDRDGGGGSERRIATEPSTDVVVAAALPNGTFAVSWAGRAAIADPLNLRTLVVDGNCAPVGTQQTVGTMLPALGLRQSTIAAGSDSYLIAWRADGAIRARTFTLAGAPASADTLLLAPVAGEEFSMVRLAAFAGGYAMVVAHRVGTVVSLELYRVSASASVAAALVGGSTRITDGVDNFYSGFGVASHPQGPILVTWHGCGAHGDGQGCGVFGRLFATTGAALGDALGIPTTSALDQVNASATAVAGPDGEPMFAVTWNDSSGAAPDASGTSVRARIIYPAR
jgi:hypothetical protein